MNKRSKGLNGKEKKFGITVGTIITSSYEVYVYTYRTVYTVSSDGKNYWRNKRKESI